MKGYVRKSDKTKTIWTRCPKPQVWASGNSFQPQILPPDSLLPTVKSFAPEGTSDSATWDLEMCRKSVPQDAPTSGLATLQPPCPLPEGDETQHRAQKVPKTWSLHLETGGAPGAGVEEVCPARSRHSQADITEPQPKLATGRAKSLPISLWLWSHQHTDTCH